MHTLRAHQIKKSFSTNPLTSAVLCGINYTFKSSCSYAITGVSGTGKSTLMHILASIDSPTSGAVFFDDQNVCEYTRAQKDLFRNHEIGVVFQESYLISELSVVENVMLYGMIGQEPYQQAYSKALTLLKTVGLANKAAHHPKSLSGGQQQKIAVLRAIFNQPKFLLADEPTGSLDRESAQEIIMLLKNTHAQGTGLIVSSHDPEIARELNQKLTLANGLLHEQL